MSEEVPDAVSRLDAQQSKYQERVQKFSEWCSQNQTTIQSKPMLLTLKEDTAIEAEKCVNFHTVKRRSRNLYERYCARMEKLQQIEPLLAPLIPKLEKIQLHHFEKLETLQQSYQKALRTIEEATKVVGQCDIQFGSLMENADTLFEYRPGFRTRMAYFEAQLTKVREMVFEQRMEINRQNAYLEMKLQLNGILETLEKSDNTLLAFTAQSDDFVLVTEDQVGLDQRLQSFYQSKKAFEDLQYPLSRLSAKMDRLCGVSEGERRPSSALVVLSEGDQFDIQDRYQKAMAKLSKTEALVSRLDGRFLLLKEEREFLLSAKMLLSKMERDIQAIEKTEFPRPDGEALLQEFAQKIAQWQSQIGQLNASLTTFKEKAKEPIQERIMMVLEENRDCLKKSMSWADYLYTEKRSHVESHLAMALLNQKVTELDADFDEALSNMKSFSVDSLEETGMVLDVLQEDISTIATFVDKLRFQFKALPESVIASKIQPLRSKIDTMRQFHEFKEHLWSYRQSYNAVSKWMGQILTVPLPELPSEVELCNRSDSQSILAQCQSVFGPQFQATLSFETDYYRDFLSSYEKIPMLVGKELDLESYQWVESSFLDLNTKWTAWRELIENKSSSVNLLLNINPEYETGRKLEAELLVKVKSFSFDMVLRVTDKVEVDELFLQTFASDNQELCTSAASWTSRNQSLTAQSHTLGPIIISISQAIDTLRQNISTSKNLVAQQKDLDSITVKLQELEQKNQQMSITDFAGNKQAQQQLESNMTAHGKLMQSWIHQNEPFATSCKAFANNIAQLQQVQERFDVISDVLRKLRDLREVRASWDERLADLNSIETLEPELFQEELQKKESDFNFWLANGKYHQTALTAEQLHHLRPEAYSAYISSTVHDMRQTVGLLQSTKEDFYLKHEEILQRIQKHMSTLDSKLISANSVNEVEGFLEAADKKAVELIGAVNEWEASWVQMFKEASVEPFKLLLDCKMYIKKSLSTYQSLAVDGKKMKDLYAAAQEITSTVIKAYQAFEQSGYGETDKDAFDGKFAAFSSAYAAFESKRDQWINVHRKDPTSKLNHKATLIKKADDKLFKPAKEKVFPALQLAKTADKAYRDMVELQHSFDDDIQLFRSQMADANAKRIMEAKIEDCISHFNNQFKEFQSEFSKWKGQLERSKAAFKVLDPVSERSKDLVMQAEILVTDSMQKAGFKHRMMECESSIERLLREVEEVGLKFQEINPTLIVANTVMAMDIQATDGTFKSTMSLDETPASETTEMKSKLGGIKGSLDVHEGQLKDLGIQIQHLEDAITGLKMFEDVFASDPSLTVKREKIEKRCKEMRATQASKLLELSQQKEVQLFMSEVMEFRKGMQQILQQCVSVTGSALNLSSTSGDSHRMKRVQGSELNLTDTLGRQLASFEAELTNITPTYEDLRERGGRLLRDTAVELQKSSIDISKPNSFIANSIAANNRKNVTTFVDILQKAWQDAQRYNIRKIVNVFLAESASIETWLEEKDRTVRDLVQRFQMTDIENLSDIELETTRDTLKEIKDEISTNADVEQLGEHAQSTIDKISHNQKQCNSIHDLTTSGSGNIFSNHGSPEINKIRSQIDSIQSQWQQLQKHITEAGDLISGAQEALSAERKITQLETEIASITIACARVNFFFARPKQQEFVEAERYQEESTKLEAVEAGKLKLAESLATILKKNANTIKRNVLVAAKVETMKQELETLGKNISTKADSKSQRAITQEYFSRLAQFSENLVAVRKVFVLPSSLTELTLNELESLQARVQELEGSVAQSFHELQVLRKDAEPLINFNRCFGIELQNSRIALERQWELFRSQTKADGHAIANAIRHMQAQQSIAALSSALGELQQSCDAIERKGAFTIQEIPSLQKVDDWKLLSGPLDEKYQSLIAEAHGLEKSPLRSLRTRIQSEIDVPAELLQSAELSEQRTFLWNKFQQVESQLRAVTSFLEKQRNLSQFTIELESVHQWLIDALSLLPGHGTSRFRTEDIQDCHDSKDLAQLESSLKEDQGTQQDIRTQLPKLDAFIAHLQKNRLARMSQEQAGEPQHLERVNLLKTLQTQLREQVRESMNKTETYLNILHFLRLEATLNSLIIEMQQDRKSYLENLDEDIRKHLEHSLLVVMEHVEQLIHLNMKYTLNEFVLEYRKDRFVPRPDAAFSLLPELGDPAQNPGYIAHMFTKHITDIQCDLEEFDRSNSGTKEPSDKHSKPWKSISQTDSMDARTERQLQQKVESFLLALKQFQRELEEDTRALRDVSKQLPVELTQSHGSVNRSILDGLNLQQHFERFPSIRDRKMECKERIQLLRDQHQALLEEFDSGDSNNAQMLWKCEQQGILFRSLSALQMTFKLYQTETIQYQHLVQSISINTNRDRFVARSDVSGTGIST